MNKKQEVKGIMTVEMSYLIPMILSIFLLIIYTVFYFHDKAILNGAAGETAALWAQIERRPEGSEQMDLNQFWSDRIESKLILFSEAAMEMNKSDDQVWVNVHAQKGKMRVEISRCALVVRPEERIRQKRLIESFVKQEE